jgi:adsorption protein B
LRWVNYSAARDDFIPLPVLALKTPWWALTHGISCVEFAECHTRDMPVRPMLGGFIPSAGVGTAYRRDALERLALSRSNRIFETESLTEDYENGLQMFRLGCTQAFVPLVRAAAQWKFVATREYFPQNWRAALRQRTRWVMGIALQGWQRFGWGNNAGETYWLWRDRKGLIASPLGFAANLIFLYGAATGIWTRSTSFTSRLAFATAMIAAIRLGVRMLCSGRVYGIAFALGVPIRAVCANALNATATVNAVARYAIARARHLPLVWLKTAHAFPSQDALREHRQRLGEILVGSGYVSAFALDSALASRPENLRIGEHLVKLKLVDEDSLYQALSLQQGLPVTYLDPSEVSPRVAHTLPAHAIRRWRVLPFKVVDGSMLLATPEVPSNEMSAALREFTTLKMQFHLMTPTRFETLENALL